MNTKEFMARKRMDSLRKDMFKYSCIGGGYTFTQCEDEIFLKPLQQIIPSLRKAKGTNYTWVGEWNDHVRAVVKLNPLRGYDAFIKWGYNYDFIPVPVYSSLKDIHYQRTDRQAAAQLVGLTDAYAFNKTFYYEAPLLRSKNEQLLKDYNETVMQIVLPQISAWYERIVTLQDMIDETERLERLRSMHNIFVPHFTYTRAFLLMRQGKEKEALDVLHCSRTYSGCHELQQQKIKKKLLEVKNL